MCIKDLDDIVGTGSIAKLGTCNAFAHEPVAAEKGRGAPVERVPEHGALLYGPPG